ncbi:hypothetical protein BJX76DRAFT_358741 [Aspergillus varians]
MPKTTPQPPSPLATWTEDARAARAAITHELDAGRDVIAVAHSFGGIAMSEAVRGLGKEDRRKTGRDPGMLRLVYMCAMALQKSQAHVGQMAPVTAEEERYLNFPTDASRTIFYNRCDPVDVERAVDLLGTFPPGPLAVPVTCAAYLEERMIVKGGGVFVVERCAEGHSPFLSDTSFVVRCLRRAAGEDRV